MASPIDTLSKAGRFGMVVEVKCRRCGNVRHFLASDLSWAIGGNRDPYQLRLRCTSCPPPPTDIKLIAPDMVKVDKLRLWRPVLDGLRVTGWKPEEDGG